VILVIKARWSEFPASVISAAARHLRTVTAHAVWIAG
jgi:hypothetical protein